MGGRKEGREGGGITGLLMLPKFLSPLFPISAKLYWMCVLSWVLLNREVVHFLIWHFMSCTGSAQHHVTDQNILIDVKPVEV